MARYLEALEAHRPELDSLNVFPVPDGDTGTNLLLTQRAVERALSVLDASPDAEADRACGAMGRVCDEIARAALLGARGNSGVILAQVLGSLSTSLRDGQETDPFAEGLRRASEEAYRAVSEPAEGTALTVLRDAGDAAVVAASGGGSVAEQSDAALMQARATLARTPDMVPALASANVVDAGGLGIVLLLDALRAAIRDTGLSVAVGPLGPVGVRGLEAPATEQRFEVQFVLEAPERVIPALRDELAGLGDSLVVAGGGGLSTVHVHTNDPDAALGAGRRSGTTSQESVVSLEERIAACWNGSRVRADASEQATGLVAVADGAGLARVFRSLGAVVVSGGPGRDPAVGDLVAAIDATPGEAAIVLPNSVDASAVAAIAADLAHTAVRVLATTSAPAGLAAATAWNPTATVEANATAMGEAAAACAAGEVGEALVEASTGAGPVRPGEWVAVRAGEVVAVDEDASAAALRLVATLRADSPRAEVVTVVLGEGAGERDHDPVVHGDPRRPGGPRAAGHRRGTGPVPVPDRGRVTRLTLDSSIGEIDRRLAQRRSGFRTKGEPAEAVLASAWDIRTVGQLLRHYPRRYIDRSATVPIRDVRFNQQVTVIGKVARVNQRRTRRGQPMVTVTVFDGSGYLDLTFFNQPWVATQYRQGVELAVSGLAQSYRGRLQLANQEVEVLRGLDAETVHTGRITPVHPAADGITTRTIRELVHVALQALGPIHEPLPHEIVASERMIDEDRALRSIHFPDDERALAAAIERLKFDELFTLELGVAYRKRRLERAAIGVVQRDDELVEPFLAGLPFRPTGGQDAAIAEVLADMSAPKPMNRLLQGDVGSGKTVVALAAAMRAIGSGHQATIMAPTEVLAGQHVRTATALLEPLGAIDARSEAAPATRPGGVADDQGSLFGGGANGGDTGSTEPDARDAAEVALAPTAVARRIRFALLSASVTGKERQRILDGVAEGAIDLVIGTHALVQEGVAFADLSLAVIDEQHRFGVHQRITLKEKGSAAGADPDVLIMTATPIPRTLALTYYGDLDVSVLDELPAGRQPIETRVARTPEERRHAYDLVRGQVGEGRQAFVVCAAIDEGNRSDVRAAEAEAERLQAEVFPDLRIDLLHGRMRPADKEAAMEGFRAGDADVLIATTVIEVGVDVPNATVMLVENAERFGLAQLHQLRGRIGRGSHRSYCVLFDESGPENLDAHERLDAMQRTTDGFELADVDLRLRGEGTLFDVKQSGMPDLKLARLAEDADLVTRARARAFALIDADPGLDEHPELERLLRETFTGDAIDWLFHS